MAAQAFIEIVALTFALAAWLYVQLPKPVHLGQIGIAALLAYTWPTGASVWIALLGLVLMWLVAMWVIAWAAQLMGRFSGLG